MMRGVILARDCRMSSSPPPCLPSVLVPSPFCCLVVFVPSSPRPGSPVSRPGLPVLSCSFACFAITLPSLMPVGRYSFEMIGETHGTRRETRRSMTVMG